MRGRGARMEKQVALLRRLWSEPYITEGPDISNIGLGRTAGTIPIWFGTETSETVLRRVARVADGWMSIGDFLPHILRLHQYLREAGRDPAGFPIRGTLMAGDGGPATWKETAARYEAAGVTHINIASPRGLAGILEARQAIG